MKCFEIINGKWIKEKNLYKPKGYAAIKIDSISMLSSTKDADIYLITLWGSAKQPLLLTYSSEADYLADLKILEDLILK